MTSRRTTLGDILREHRRQFPDRCALVEDDYRATWPELDDRVNRLANALIAAGVEAGDRILWLGQNSFRVYELLGACAKIGAMVCPAYWRWAVPEMVFAIEDFTPKVVFWQDDEIGEHVRQAREQTRTRVPALWLQHDAEGAGTYESFLAGGLKEDPERPVDPDSALLVIYTSAVSGRPCGSMLSHTNLISMAMSVAWMAEIDHETVFLNAGPMFHIGNFEFFGMPAFIHGGTNVVIRRVNAGRMLELIHAERCTHGYVMPPTIVEIVVLNKERGLDLSHFRSVMTPHLWQGMTTQDATRYSRHGGGGGRTYGQTEVTGSCIFGAYGGAGQGNAGRGAPFTQVRILAPDGRECAIGEAGELCMRGDIVHLGYWNRPEVNERRFRHGWWHTSDLGRRERDGSITFLGTMTRMLKSAAENIFPAEVENCLESHPAVKEAAIIGVPNERWAQDVKAVVVLKPGASATEAELIEHCRANLASYKKPKTVEFVDALPRVGGVVKDYDALDARFGGGGYPGRDTLGAGR
ncbi:MAG: AMP-binding protein [Gammaproteobacteria bacterium]